MTEATYDPAVYRGTALPDLPAPAQNKQGLFDAALTWGHYANLDPASEIEGQLVSEAHLAYERQTKEKRKQQIFCDAERWNFENSSKILHFLFLFKLVLVFLFSVPWILKIADVLNSDFLVTTLGVVVMFCSLVLYGSSRPWLAYILGGILLIFTLVVIVWDQGALWGYWGKQAAFWFGAILLFMVVIGLDLLIGLYSLIYTHDGSGFSRRDGMVRIGRRFRPPFVAPFYEFDPVMQLQVTPHGGHDYVLWLHHRYTDTKVCLGMKMHSLGLDKPNLCAFWDTLQRYMDVEQPLPDLPVLEQSRHLDPVTAAHDAATGRPARYWRDLNTKSWKSSNILKGVREKVAHYPWQQQPCTLRAHINPGLSIETYYRAQEARGIEATPKADDFDAIHRG